MSFLRSLVLFLPIVGFTGLALADGPDPKDPEPGAPPPPPPEFIWVPPPPPSPPPPPPQQVETMTVTGSNSPPPPPPPPPEYEIDSQGGFIMRVGWDDPASPRCDAERTLLGEFKALWEFNRSELGLNRPPGLSIMDSFKDPVFSAPGWRKLEFSRTYQYMANSYDAMAWAYKPTIHIMWNSITKQTDQLRYKNPLGCTGFPVLR